MTKYFIKTDMRRFQQVFLNLVSNAVKFTDREGTISVNVEQLSNTQLRVLVSDNGIGIKPEN